MQLVSIIGTASIKIAEVIIGNIGKANDKKMASEKKKRKLKNSYCVPSTLKNKLSHKCKRLLFYTSSQRQQEKWKIKRKLLTEWSKSFIDM